MKILLIGSGAREHILAEKLTASPQCRALYAFGPARNPGIAALAAIYEIGNANDPAAVRAFAEKYRPDFAVVGPENPIAAGVVDELEKIGVPSASPTKALGQLESSKSFTRELLAKYGIAGNPCFKIFTSEDGLMAFAKELGQIVVKADGLHGGKGVLVQGDHFKTLEEGVEAAKKFIASDGRVVIEEKFIGQEFSLMSFCDGRTIADMPAIQDHKRAFEGDTGPNTGGMGTYNGPDGLPFLTPADLRAAHAITEKVAAALEKELGAPFKGIMYGGFIAVKNGVRLIEYNARFGDPEAMNALTLLETDFVDICQAIIHGTLDNLDVRFAKKATVCKYAVPLGYPEKPQKGDEVKIGPLPAGVRAYFAAIDEQKGKLIMTGSRAVAFVGVAETIEQAEALAEQGAQSAQGPVFHRADIGTQKLIGKRVAMMEELRN